MGRKDFIPFLYQSTIDTIVTISFSVCRSGIVSTMGCLSGAIERELQNRLSYFTDICRTFKRDLLTTGNTVYFPCFLIYCQTKRPFFLISFIYFPFILDSFSRFGSLTILWLILISFTIPLIISSKLFS